MAKKRILFVNQEIAPYSNGGSEAVKGRDIPVAMQGNGFEVRTFMPKYGGVNERRNQLHEVIRLSGTNISINDNDHPLILKVASMQPSRIQVYFIDNDDYFQKEDSDCDIVGSNRCDNDERVIFFARSTVETMKKLRWEPTVIQCTGWFTSLVPVFLREQTGEPHVYKSSKVVYTVTDDKVLGDIAPNFLDKLKADRIPQKVLKPLKGLPLDTNLLHRLAITAVDAVVFDTEVVDEELMALVKSRNIPFITRKELEENGLEAYTTFYNKITSGGKHEELAE